MIEFSPSQHFKRKKKKSPNIIDDLAPIQKKSSKNIEDDKKEKSEDQLMVVQASISSLELGSESPHISQKEASESSLNVTRDVVSPTGKETPSIFKKKKDQMLKEAEVKASKNEAFTEVELQDAWKHFIELRKKEVVSEMEQLILTRQMIKKGMNAFIMLNSSLEIAILDRIEADLVNFLREALSNDQLVLQKEIREDLKKGKIFTSKDKYDFMVKEQPLLQKLKDKLGLDFEY